MKKEFYYVKFGLWYRPIIPITLIHGKREVDYIALIDSGADFNIFHNDVAEVLGIDLKKMKNGMQFAGIKEGAHGKGYFTSVDLSIDQTSFSAPVVFSNDISNNGYGILGQQGFFNNFNVEFDYQKKRIVIRK